MDCIECTQPCHGDAQATLRPDSFGCPGFDRDPDDIFPAGQCSNSIQDTILQRDPLLPDQPRSNRIESRDQQRRGVSTDHWKMPSPSPGWSAGESPIEFPSILSEQRLRHSSQDPQSGQESNPQPGQRAQRSQAGLQVRLLQIDSFGDDYLLLYGLGWNAPVSA